MSSKLKSQPHDDQIEPPSSSRQLRLPLRRPRVMSFSRNKFPEMQELEDLVKIISPYARIEVPATVKARDREFPIYTIALGSQDPKAPVLGLFGGVHGLERIGSHVVLSFLHTITELLAWDEWFHEKLSRTRLIFIPLINPGGMFLRQRSNPNGVDLMRNAPVEALGKPSFLLSGHRISKMLPWYRGALGAPMEVEAQVLCDFVKAQTFNSVASICLDVHSGFGAVDRLWFPYAKTVEPFPHLAEFAGLNDLLLRTYPHHFYRVEPQAQQYTTHGDLWDYLYDEFRAQAPERMFMPLCLEMGSWMLVKKNPRQVFSALGPFNPIEPHRHRRILRRHLTLIDFLHRAVFAYPRWALLSKEDRERFPREAMALWFSGHAS